MVPIVLRVTMSVFITYSLPAPWAAVSIVPSHNLSTCMVHHHHPNGFLSQMSDWDGPLAPSTALHCSLAQSTHLHGLPPPCPLFHLTIICLAWSTVTIHCPPLCLATV